MNNNTKKNKFKGLNKGMTYVELIVVLGIFSVLNSVLLFDYNKFQQKVEIKVLANEIALKLVEAQKSSILGRLSARIPSISDWKPSYGLHFDLATNNKSFTYYTDLDNDSILDEDATCVSECLDKISITKGNYVSGIAVEGTGGCPASITNVSVVFKRPDSNAIITSNPSITCTITDVKITVISKQGLTKNIKIYPSGLIQVE